MWMDSRTCVACGDLREDGSNNNENGYNSAQARERLRHWRFLS